MKKALRIIALSLAVALGVALCGCTAKPADDTDSGKLKIVSTIFPPYDFAKAITGGNAEISILLPPGSESHHYEPSPSDIIKIRNCDIFLYIGGENEVWAEKLLTDVDREKTKTVKLIDSVELLAQPEADGEHHMEENEHHAHEFDQHIWTSPANAEIMLDTIYSAICEADSENTDTYTENRDSYKNELQKLDSDFKAAVDGAKSKTLIFGDRFPFVYLASRYGLTCYAAFGGCSDDTEPSASAVTSLITRVKSENIPIVYYLEFSSSKTADTICRETGAKAVKLHTCHNLSKEELERGETYISLMYKNLDAIKQSIE